MKTPMVKILLLVLCLSLLLGACGNAPSVQTEPADPQITTEPTVTQPEQTEPMDTREPTDAAPVDAPEPETSTMSREQPTYPIPAENITAGNVLHGAPSANGNGYYSTSSLLKYTDIDAEDLFLLCAQSGCKHSDETCQAWIGKQVGSVFEYRGELYAVTFEDEYAQFIKKDMATGERTVLDSRKRPVENDYVGVAVVAEGKCVLRYWKDPAIYVMYDLAAAQAQELPGELADWGIVDLYDDDLLLMRGDYKLSREEYELSPVTQEEFPTYEDYLESRLGRELRRYDLETGESEVIATEEQGLIFTGDPASSYGHTFVYQLGDDICLYDMQTGTSRVAITMERVINFWLLDHKLFLIQSFTGKPGDGCYIYYMDMDGGELFRLENQGETESMYMSVMWEGNDFFCANCGGGKRVIRKDDFYAERYDQAWAGGY